MRLRNTLLRPCPIVQRSRNATVRYHSRMEWLHEHVGWFIIVDAAIALGVIGWRRYRRVAKRRTTDT